METFQISGMKCEENCAQTIKKCVLEINEVETAFIDFLNSKLIVTYKNKQEEQKEEQKEQKEEEQEEKNINYENISEKVAMTIENAGYTVKWGQDLSIKYFKIDGMYCEHCVGTVNKAIQNIIGVKNVIVNLNRHIATVIVYSNCNELDIINAIVAVGYDATSYEGSRDVYLQITGMECQKRCGNAVHNALRKVNGVACVQVDVAAGQAVVRGSAKFEDLAAAVEQAGYTAKSTPATSSRPSSCCSVKNASDANSDNNTPTFSPLHIKDSGIIITTTTNNNINNNNINNNSNKKKNNNNNISGNENMNNSKMNSKNYTRLTPDKKLNNDCEVGSLADNRTIFEVKGMSCGACVSAIERLLISYPGVEQASVALLTERAHVVYDSSRVTWQTLLSAIENAGYRAKHLGTRRNDNSDCRQRSFLVEASKSITGDIRASFNGLNTLLATAGVLEAKWVDSEDNVESEDNKSIKGLQKLCLEVTYDPAIVGLRVILESMTVSNPQLTITLMKQKNDTVDTFSNQKVALEELWNELIIAVVFSAPLTFIMWTGLFMDEIYPGLQWMDVIAIILSTLCQFISGKRFYEEAYRGIQTRTLGMGFLVALGTTCAYLFGLFSILQSITTHGETPSYTDNLMTSTMLITFVLFGKYLESRAKTYTSMALKKLMDHQPKTAILLTIKSNSTLPTLPTTTPNNNNNNNNNNNLLSYTVESERVVSTDLLEENDIVKVVRGMTIPVDGEVIHGHGEVNEALITGEAMPVTKSSGDDVIGGTQLLEGTLHIKVRTIPENSVLQQIIKLVENAQMQKAPIQQTADQIAGKFALVVMIISILVFIIWYVLLTWNLISRKWLPSNLSDFVISFTFSISTLVVACPCAMGLATPTAIMVGTGVGAKLGILIKGGEALETANKLTSIVFDKTGTLTMGCPEVSNIYLLSSSGSKMVLVHGHQTDGVEAVNQHTKNPLFETIIQSDSNNSKVRITRVPSVDMTQSNEFVDENGLLWMVASAELNSEHVIGRAIVQHALSKPNFPPLESSVDMNATTGRGIKCMVKGYEVMVGSLKYLREEGVEHSHNSTFQNMSIAAEDVGSIVVFAAINGSMRAMIQLTDKPRPEAFDTIQALQTMGKKVWMVTGDNIRTARSIAAAVGIPAINVISEALPSTKIQHVSNLQEDGEYVGFVGDGINDAPAVAQANIGIAMGGGTDVAMESADMVLMRPNVFNVVIAIDLSHSILRCIHRNLFWALAYNVIAIPIAAGLSIPLFHTIIPPWIAGGAMAMSSVSVVLSSLSLLYYQPPNQSLYSNKLNDELNNSNNSINIIHHNGNQNIINDSDHSNSNSNSNNNSNNLSNSYQGISSSISTLVDSPLPSIKSIGLESLLSFADGMLEMDEGKQLLLDKKKKYGTSSDNNV